MIVKESKAKPVMLLILDGFGVAPNSQGNAITLAQPENLIKYWSAYPHTYLQAASEAVGLSPNTDGNSEVGHLNIGAGRVVYQNLPRINKAIEKGTFAQNNVLHQILQHATTHNSRVHLLGCFSDGAVHSHITHLKALIDFFSTNSPGIPTFIHAFTDGRDTPPQSAERYFTEISNYLISKNNIEIASICGRAFAMDRNERWDRTSLAYDLLFEKNQKTYPDWNTAISDARTQNEIDEYIQPRRIKTKSDPVIQNNDVVFFFNFRPDRALQLAKAIYHPEEKFEGFRTTDRKNLFFASMVEYAKSYPQKVLFPKEYIRLSLGRILAESNLKQLRIAESEKFPHVTYFFNGGIPIQYSGEDRIEIPSPIVSTYDQMPIMSLPSVTKKLVEMINLNIYSLIIVNFANGDMVAHTGNLAATIQAIKAVDVAVGIIVKTFMAKGGTVLITADHGNSEELLNLHTGEIDTEHSSNPVPLIITDNDLVKSIPNQLPYGALKDIAPTVLKILKIDQPGEMTGKSVY